LAEEHAVTEQAPFEHVPDPQFWHCDPPTPHAFCALPVMHIAPRQQPPQLEGPQGAATQTPALPSHTAPTDEQFWQEAPFVPHVAFSVPSTQRKPPAPLASQQPVGQDAALHVCMGVSHAWLVGSHCEKPSVWQFAHVAPAVPHWVICVPAWQLPLPSQQPEGQVEALQVVVTVVQVCVWAEQVLFEAQLEQARPPVPHAAVEVPAWQLPFESQQPVGHVEGPQLPDVESVVITIMPLSSGSPWSRSERPHPTSPARRKSSPTQSGVDVMTSCRNRLAPWNMHDPSVDWTAWRETTPGRKTCARRTKATRKSLGAPRFPDV
jgi:hypothetical protein